MPDFRKWFFALVALAVLVGITADTAAAQAFQCTANAGVPARVRGEGRTELVGDLILNCQGVVPVTPLVANIQIFLSTNITSRILETTYNSTEALLTLNDPSPLSAATNTQIVSVVPAVAPPVGPSPAGANVFKGVKAGDNSLLWTSIPIVPVTVPPGSTTTQIIRITNVRANAAQAFSQGQTFIPQQLTMFVTVTSSTAIPINNPTQVVGAVLKGLDFAYRNCGDSDSGDTTFAQCGSVNGDLYGDSTKTGQTMHGLLKYTEGFDAAFKIRIIPPVTGVTTSQNGAPLGAYNANSESGYVNGSAAVGVAPVAGASGVLGDVIGVANTGTRLIARFANIPAGVKLFVTTADYVTGTSTTIDAVLISVTDPTGIGGSSGFPVAATGTASCGAGNAGIVEVPLFGGAGAATWEITASNGSAVETAAFGLAVAFSTNPSANIPALTLGVHGTASGNFAPVSSDDKMSATSPIPRFADLPISSNVLEIAACATNLLFPFVSARGGFDTGIAISNTTADNAKNLSGSGVTANLPYNTRTQNGACVLYYFGDKEDGTSLAKPVQTSGVINAGKQLVYTLFGGGAGIDATPGFQGYIIATCAFSNAHGFAFIADLGAQKLAMGYLALIIPTSNGSRRPTGTEALDN